MDISIAVATPTGLMVPVLRDCQNKKFHELELVYYYLIHRGWGNLLKKENKGKLVSKICKEEPSLFPMVALLVL